MAQLPPNRARPRRTVRIGLTGGIASGKSTVAKLFGALGIPIIDSDQIARELLVPGAPLLARLIERFGSEMLQADGSLNRAALRTVIFSDARAREALDALTHPAIREQMQRRARELEGRYQIHVIPLLIETGLRERGLDRVLLVDCPQELQIRRLQGRDGSTREEAARILAAQASREARLAAADDVVVNDGDLQHLRADVERLHAKYLELAATA